MRITFQTLGKLFSSRTLAPYSMSPSFYVPDVLGGVGVPDAPDAGADGVDGGVSATGAGL